MMTQGEIDKAARACIRWCETQGLDEVDAVPVLATTILYAIRACALKGADEEEGLKIVAHMIRNAK